MAFCEPLKQISMRCLSTFTGTAASDATVSTTSRRAALVRYLAERIDVGHYAGGGFTLRQANHLDLAALGYFADIFRFDRLA